MRIRCLLGFHEHGLYWNDEIRGYESRCIHCNTRQETSMKRLTTIAILCVLLAAAAAQAQYTVTAFFSHETNAGGLTKQCHYKYLNEFYSITVSNTEICPLQIQVQPR